MSHLCKASSEKVARDAAKAEERQAAGKSYFRCERCKRISHNDEHLCKPEKIKAQKVAKSVKEPVIEASPLAVEASAGDA